MAAYQEALGELAAAGVDVVALSTDTPENAAATVERLGLGFPFGYGVPLGSTAKVLGIYFEERRSILHAAAFLLGPDRRIEVAVASSGAVGRLQPDELLRLVRFWDRDRPQPPVSRELR